MTVTIPRRKNLCRTSKTETETGNTLSVLQKLKLVALLAAGLAGAMNHTSAQTTNVYVDPAQNWLGYMNVYNYPPDGNAPIFGSTWGTADLSAAFAGNVLTLTPNYNIDRDAPSDPFYWNPDGSPAKNMDANFYVQNDALAGQTITFSGYCWTNTLVEPYSNNVTAFIKDFVADYSSSTSITTNLTGGFFSITLPTTPGDHIQYGFEMIGPDARRSNAVANGSAIVASNPPPAGPVVTAFPNNPTVLVGSDISLDAAATGSNIKFQWYKNGTSITSATNASLVLTNVNGGAEADYSLIVSNTVGSATNQTHLTVLTPNHLTVDPRAGWVGFMNVFALPQDGGGYQFGSSWGVKDLRAQINGAIITMTPNTNTYDPTNTYWVNPDGSGAKSMDAVLYQQFDGLTNMVITFSGFCLSNNLDPAYTNTVFIRDFLPNFSGQYASASAALIPGQPFSITLDMSQDPPGNHIQWGFEMIGPDANPNTAAALGAVVVSIQPPTLTVAGSTNAVNLNLPTESGLNYTVQYKTNLTVGAWQTLTNVWGNGTNIVVTNSVSPGARFYRSSAQ